MADKNDPLPLVDQSMDSTRMDIDINSLKNRDFTKTQIKIPDETKGQTDEKSAPKPIEKTKEKPKEKPKKPVALKKVIAGKGSRWTPPAQMSSSQRMSFLLSRFIIAAVGLGIFLLLLQSFFFAHQHHLESEWILMGVAGGTFVLMLLSFLLKASPAFFIIFPLMSLVGICGYTQFFYPSFSLDFFTLMGKSIGSLQNSIWIGLCAYELILFIFLAERAILFRALSFLVLVYGLVGLVVNLMKGVPLEASWYGVGFFEQIPIFFAQPAYVVMNLGLFLALMSLFTWLFARKELSVSGRSAWISLNVLLCLMMGALGSIVLYKNRVPGLWVFGLPAQLSVGSVVESFAGSDFIVDTANYEKERKSDNLLRYRLWLTNYDKKVPAKPNEGPQDKKFFLTVTDVYGLPIYFLTKDDLKLQIDGSPWTDWNLADVKASNSALDKSDPVRRPQYILTVKNFVKGAQKNPQIGTESNTPLRASVIWATPMMNDTVGENVSLFLDVQKTSKVKKVSFFIDEQLLFESDHAPFGGKTSIASYADGDHQLKAVLTWDDGKTSEERIAIKKSATFPSINLAKPTFGQYISAEAPVEITTQNTFVSHELFLNGVKITDDISASKPFIWNNQDVATGQHLLQVKGKTAEGQETSAWVQVNLGESKLKVSSESTKVFNKIVFVVDASRSMLDRFDGKSKWINVKSAITEQSLQNDLKEIQVGLVFYGNSVIDSVCDDAVSIGGRNKYDKDEVLDAFKDFNPAGVSRLFASLKEAVKSKPDKIIVFTDGGDSCSKNIPSEITKSKTPIDILALGDLDEKDSEILKKISESTQGTFKSVGMTREITDTLKSLLSLQYQLINQKGAVVFSQAIDGKEHKVRSGHYQFRANIQPTLPESPMDLSSGQAYEYVLKIKDDQTVLEALSSH